MLSKPEFCSNDLCNIILIKAQVNRFHKSNLRRGSDDVMKSVFFGMVLRFGKSFMLPNAVLPAAGLLLGIRGAFSNPATVAAYPFLDQVLLQGLFTIMSSAGNIVFPTLLWFLLLGLR